MSNRVSVNEIKGNARKANGFPGYEIQFSNKNTGKLLRFDELPEGLYDMMADMYWAYMRGGYNKDSSWREQKFFNVKATKEDLEFFRTGEYLKVCKEYAKKAKNKRANTAPSPVVQKTEEKPVTKKATTKKPATKKTVEPKVVDYSKMTKKELLALLASLA